MPFVRSAAGNLFRIPLVYISSVEELKTVTDKTTYIATVVNYSDAVAPEKIDFTKPFVLLLGSEADGLSQKAIEMSDIKTNIKISDKVESLNLSIAASILFYIAGMQN